MIELLKCFTVGALILLPIIAGFLYYPSIMAYIILIIMLIGLCTFIGFGVLESQRKD